MAKQMDGQTGRWIGGELLEVTHKTTQEKIQTQVSENDVFMKKA